MRTIYLDNNTTTQVAPEVLETILPYFHELYGNPSSVHSFGGQVAEKVAEARAQVAGLLGARPGEIIFTSGGTESDNAAVRSALAAYPEKRHIVTSQVEHPAIFILSSIPGGLAHELAHELEKQLPVDKTLIATVEEA